MPLYLIVIEGKPGNEASVASRKATRTSCLVFRTLLDGFGRRLSKVPALLNLSHKDKSGNSDFTELPRAS